MDNNFTIQNRPFYTDSPELSYKQPVGVKTLTEPGNPFNLPAADQKVIQPIGNYRMKCSRLGSEVNAPSPGTPGGDAPRRRSPVPPASDNISCASTCLSLFKNSPQKISHIGV